MKTPLLTLVALALLAPFISAQETSTLENGTKITRNMPYVPGGGVRQMLDIAVPPGEGKHPLVVWIHGGAWIGGSKDGCPAVGMLAKGYVVASINYRYSTQAVFPAQLEDCKAAIRWLRAHAAEYAIDPKRIGVWGASAGGHLVALLGVTGDTKEFDKGENLDQSSAVQCVLDWFGPTDFPHYDENHPEIKINDPTSVVSKLFGGTVAEKMELATKASPALTVHAGVPPFLIMHGTIDNLVPLDQSERLRDALVKAGCECKLDVVDGAGHGGKQFTTPERIQMMTDFFEKNLSVPPKS